MLYLLKYILRISTPSHCIIYIKGSLNLYRNGLQLIKNEAKNEKGFNDDIICKKKRCEATGKINSSLHNYSNSTAIATMTNKL